MAQRGARFLQKELASGELDDENASNRLWEAFIATHDSITCDPSLDCTLSGATLTVSILNGCTLTTAWVGDSRAVLVRQVKDSVVAYDLTVDHKPDLPEELLRIEQTGGRVQPLVVCSFAFPLFTNMADLSALLILGLCACSIPSGVSGLQDEFEAPFGPARVWLADAWLPGLAMSRSLGDTVAASCGVTHCPEVSVVTITDADICSIWASDGLWEFVSSQEAAQVIASCQNATDAAKALAAFAAQRWESNEPDVSDDISVVVIYYQGSRNLPGLKVAAPPADMPAP